jgi:nucleoid-associated protein YgaU
VKEAFAKVSEADSALKTAMERTYKALALEKLEAAKTALANMQKAEIPAEFSADLETASSLVKYSGEDFENKSYLPSMTKSSDALALLNTMTIAMEKKREEARISGEKGVLPGEGRDLAGTPSDAAIPGEYVVRYNPKKRDCLWRIGHTVYRDARLWPLIYIANRDQIKDPDLIFPGQKFKIPPIPRKETVKEEKKEGAKSPEEAGEKQPVDKAE